MRLVVELGRARPRSEPVPLYRQPAPAANKSPREHWVARLDRSAGETGARRVSWRSPILFGQFSSVSSTAQRTHARKQMPAGRSRRRRPQPLRLALITRTWCALTRPAQVAHLPPLGAHLNTGAMANVDCGAAGCLTPKCTYSRLATCCSSA